MTDRRILTRQEAAQYLSIGLSTLDKLVAQRENPLPHIRTGRRVLIPRDALEAWLNSELKRQSRNGGEV